MKRLAILLTFAVLVSFATTNVSAQLPQMMVTGQLGYHQPMSDFADFADRGLGVGATFDYFLMPNLSIYGMLGYTSWSNTDLEELDQWLDITLTEIPFKAGVKYFLSDKDFMPYVGAELGMHNFTVKYDVTVLGISVPGDSETESEIGFAPVVGFLMPISDNLYFIGCAKYTVINTDNYYDVDGGSFGFHYLSIFAGVSLAL